MHHRRVEGFDPRENFHVFPGGNILRRLLHARGIRSKRSGQNRFALASRLSGVRRLVARFGGVHVPEAWLDTRGLLGYSRLIDFKGALPSTSGSP